MDRTIDNGSIAGVRLVRPRLRLARCIVRRCYCSGIADRARLHASIVQPLDVAPLVRWP